ncbi:MAG: bifunctional riboflavin kinase/FAD synthetase [Lachnospiraceae bacterium]|nr:bifunctional riboflavin kinase/FAD synthetase [Lachnospiraceae bacterium]
MEILNGLDFKLTNSAVSLGKFDGIHRGHRLLLKQILEQDQWSPTVFTFGAVQGNGIMPGQQIYSKKEQRMILEELGIKREIIFPFNEETRKITAEEFIQNILVEKIDAKLICVGEDFHFGKNRQGDVELLSRLADRYGYRLKVYPKLTCDGENISSTRIRWELSTGKLDKVNELLGAPYFICGEVVHGNALGRTIGMPTANIIPEQGKVLPVFGVYATTVEVDGKEYAGVTNIGLKPTVGAENATVETILINFSGDLYGKEMVVRFHHFLRREKKFAGLEQLREQMEKDKQRAQELLQVFGVSEP